MEQILLDQSKQIKIPTASTRLWKDECAYSFDTPEKDEGLFIDLKSFLSFGKNFIELNQKKTGDVLYLNYKKVVLPSNNNSKLTNENQPPPKKLAIGVEGGFQLDEDEIKYQDIYRLYNSVSKEYLEITDEKIPKIIRDTIEKVILMNSQSRKEEILQWNAEQVFPSAFAETIVQIDNGVKIAKEGWSCSVVGCDKKENLWLNLSDGFIGCGRKYSDGTGGNGHAQIHYDETKYPISVKLGTITKDSADVYSYPEGEMVSDPLLFQHLLHFGIDPKEQNKTEKTMAELELDHNISFEFGRIQEKGKDLENVYGPGLTGIENLGNTCYMSSVLQLMFSLKSFQTRYSVSREKSFTEITQDPSQSVEIQMSKLAHGLLSGDYSIPAPTNRPENKEEYEKATQIGIAPKMFKSLIGGNHPEFSTMKQQDALEYFQYLIGYIDRCEKARPSWIQSENPTKTFNFQIEDRIECGQTRMVKYQRRLDNTWSLPVPLEAATNKEQVKLYEQELAANGGKKDDNNAEEVRPIIPLQACINSYLESYKVDDYFSSGANAKTFSINSSKLATFPDVLVIHLRKYIIDNNYQPKKLNVFMDIPDELDINSTKGKGIQNGEVLLPENNLTSGGNVSTQSKPTFVYNQENLQNLHDMGFSLPLCKKALKLNNNNIETAMDWLMEHSNDPMDTDEDDIQKPIVNNNNIQQANTITFKEADIDMLCQMGFSLDQAKLALKNTSNDVERAAEWIFSHMDNLDELVNADKASSTGNVGTPTNKDDTNTLSNRVNDGNAKYRLLGFISHIGSNVHFGHYVCHIRKNGKWVKFNDRHVQLSEQPPKEMGYIYFYERI